MKKLLLSLLIIVACTTTAVAQTAICPEAGLYMANLSLITNKGPVSTTLEKSLTIGAFIDHGFSKHFYLQPGLFYVRNGCSVTDVGWYKINTIQVPVNIEYKSAMPGSTSFFAGAGIYFGYNIGGTARLDDSTFAIKIGSNKNTDDIKAIDLGIGVNAGLLLSDNFYFRLQYQSGLNDLIPGGDADNSAKTFAIGITIGYSFGVRKHTGKNKTLNKL